MNKTSWRIGLLVLGFFMSSGCLRAEILISEEPEADSQGPGTAQGTLVPAVSGEEAAAGTEALQIEVIDLEGEVLVKLREKADFEPAQEGALLEAGVILKTSAGAYAELGFDEKDENVVRIDESTTTLLVLKEDEKIALLEGEVFSIIKNLSSGAAFEIRTPTAVAGARGTEWVTRYRDEQTDVEAVTDTPYVKSVDSEGKAAGEETAIAPGFATSIKRSQPPAAAQRIPGERLRRFSKIRQGMKQRIQRVRQKRGMPQRDPKKFRRFGAKAGLRGRASERAGDRRQLTGQNGTGALRERREKEGRGDRLLEMPTVAPESRKTGQPQQAGPAGADVQKTPVKKPGAVSGAAPQQPAGSNVTLHTVRSGSVVQR